MGLKDKVKKGTLKVLEDNAEKYANKPFSPLKETRKATNRIGYISIGFPIREASLRKLNLISFIEGTEKQHIRERAIDMFLKLYDENGKLL